MLFFFSFCLHFVVSWQDIRDGQEYEDSSMKRLTGALSATKSVLVRASVETIKGGSKSTEGFAYSFRHTLENIDFEENGNLVTIESYSFQETTKLRVLNLSRCKRLKTINSYAFDQSGVDTLIFPTDGVFESTGAFSFQNTSITKVVFPKSIISVGHSMFKMAQKIQTISFAEDSICTTINDFAFEASGIVRIEIPKKVSYLNAKAFARCYYLSEIIVEYGSTSFVSENNILYNSDYSSLVCFPRALNIDVVVRSGVESVLDEAFRTCSVKSIVFPSSLKYIGYNVMNSCGQLTSITFPDGLENMSTYALQMCGIGEFIVPASLTYLSEYLLNSCEKLTTVHIHNKVTHLKQGCFMGCTSLTTLDVPDSVITISPYVCRDCISLIDVILPQTKNDLGGGIFENCNKNLVVRFRTTGRYQTDENTIIYLDEKSIIIQMYADSVSEITLPSSVSRIKSGAFAGKSITKIQLNSGLIYIEERAFANCKSLESISLPTTVSSLGNAIFSNSGIKSISLGAVKTLPQDFLSQCLNLSSIVIPSSVQTIGKTCFSMSGLESITFQAGDLTKIDDEAFSSCESLGNVVLPKSLTTLGGSVFSENSALSISFETGSQITSIPDEAFMSSKRLKSVTLPEKATKIGVYGMAYCTALETLTITKSITRLEAHSLGGCSNLRVLEIVDGAALEYIDESALEGLKMLESITASCDHFVSSDDNAVLYNKAKTQIVKYCARNNKSIFEIPNTVNLIGGCAFEESIFLKKVVIPSSVTAIGARAFAGCSTLSSLDIPLSVTTVGGLAFDGCTNMACGSVIYPLGLKDQLLLAGLSDEVLSKCVTREFTLTSSFRSVNIELLATMIEDYE